MLQFTHFVVRDVDSGVVLFDFALEDEDLSVKAGFGNMVCEGRCGGIGKGDELPVLPRLLPAEDDRDHEDVPDWAESVEEPADDREVSVRGRAIGRFFFKNQLISSFEFKFPFCIPNSTNTWEQIYNLPALSENLK